MDLFLVFFLVICAGCALVDFLIYKIPNEAILFIVALFFFKVFIEFGLDWKAFQMPLLIFAATLLVCFGLYVAKLLGAGDAKFIAVVSLWAASYNALLFFILMALAGAALGALYYFFYSVLDGVRVKLLAQMQKVVFLKGYLGEKAQAPGQKIKGKTDIVVPYGLAVFIGFILMLKMY